MYDINTSRYTYVSYRQSNQTRDTTGRAGWTFASSDDSELINPTAHQLYDAATIIGVDCRFVDDVLCLR
jgi:hypothetical protein